MKPFHASFSGMRRLTVLVASFLATASCATIPEPVQQEPAPLLTATAVIEELNRMAAQPLWPGFDARRVPIMLFDGTSTVLFNHPSPPPEFTAVEGQAGVHMAPGRHAAVTANSSTQVGGVETATVILKPDLPSPRHGAALAMHEAFHVFQRARHPRWSANEVELFTYPVMDTNLVSLEQLEMHALRRALIWKDQDACWTNTALITRRSRFAQMSPGASTYERASELNEGLATYVEQLAAGQPDSLVFPADKFLPAQVRLRTYTSGHAMARLLDRFAPTWKATLEANDTLALDALLKRALEDRAKTQSLGECEFNDVESDAVLTAASQDVDSLRAELEHHRLLFMEQPGWMLVVSTGKTPLFPQRFDPLNVQVLMRGEVLHSRYVQLGNDNGSVQLLDRAGITQAAGAHPLFNGVKLLTVAGIPSGGLTVSSSITAVTARGSGVTMDFRRGTVDTTGKVINVRLP